MSRLTPWQVGQASPVHLSVEQLVEMTNGLNAYLDESEKPICRHCKQPLVTRGYKNKDGSECHISCHDGRL